MAEIGSGSGTGYPGVIDTDATSESATTLARFGWANDAVAAVIAVQTELGVNPAGSFSTVVARLDAIYSRGNTASRPAAADGIFFMDTELGILQHSDGTDWLPIMMG